MTSEAVKQFHAKRDAQLRNVMDKWILKPRCGAFPSPELLESYQLGSDETNTIEDFRLVKTWARSVMLNTSFLDFFGKRLDESRYLSMVQTSINTVADAMRNTHQIDACEIVFFYYAGHGINPSSVPDSTLSADPQFTSSNVEYFDSIPGLNETLGSRNTRRIRGGEMCLHGAGFCDLRGLVRPFIAGLLAPSVNKLGTNDAPKSNKHFIGVIDSCYSGAFVSDVATLGRQCLPSGCSITIQSSTTAQCEAYGELFTPVFVALQNRTALEQKLTQFRTLNAAELAALNSAVIPMPQIGTTNLDIQAQINHTEKLYVETLKQGDVSIILLKPNNFYKFCVREIVGGIAKENIRQLSVEQADTFMSNYRLEVIDFKLRPHDYQGVDCLMGLFMVKNPASPTRAVCVHVHFGPDTKKVGRLNFVEHDIIVGGLWPETDQVRTNYAVIDRTRRWSVDGKVDSTLLPELQRQIKQSQTLLVECKKFVDLCKCAKCARSDDVWNNPACWDDGLMDVGHFGRFRREFSFKNYLDSLLKTEANLPRVPDSSTSSTSTQK